MTQVICYCSNCPGIEDNENGTCLLKPGAQCYSAVEEVYNAEKKSFEPLYSAGCLPPDEQSLLQCKGDLVPHYYAKSIKCCNFTDLCNENLHLSYKPRSTITPPNVFLENFYMAPMIGSFIFCFFAFFLCVTFIYCRYKKSDGSRKCLTELYNVKVQKCNNTLQDFISSSGSGAGKSLLVQRTIGRQVKKERLLGKGRYSEKWVVSWKDEKIVMKTFSTLEEDQWLRETKVYLSGLCHENVLSFIAADILKDGGRAIFTYYHKMGSLQDYLMEKCLNGAEFLNLAYSAVNSIVYLHTEILGTFKRPAVAHRNITSKNFLINNRRMCVISDFDVAILNNENFEDTKLELNMGTPRYTAPEVINETINRQCIDAFKMADIYSLGLVLWEMCRRCATVDGISYRAEGYTLPYSNILPEYSVIENEEKDIKDETEDYALPYSNILPEYPTVEDMRDLFATKKLTQNVLVFPDRWEKDKILKSMSVLVKECIHENPRIRPSALRISKSLVSLSRNYNSDLKMNPDFV